ncbi:hypothetical protein B1756_11310 [Natrarchaeobaculum aegyptiacum]|uniref:Uncharacterized protein n=1 Tax=Natrarchaeobaculum aegyptiacum TaxID=745377 RepID=A0A2Z2HT01_9EURY|nr:hypothetical protein B1756_11310 [Natrarchaeobaculum aegyptiacum]
MERESHGGVLSLFRSEVVVEGHDARAGLVLERPLGSRKRADYEYARSTPMSTISSSRWNRSSSRR